jgi:hypothetical protein
MRSRKAPENSRNEMSAILEYAEQNLSPCTRGAS